MPSYWYVYPEVADARLSYPEAARIVREAVRDKSYRDIFAASGPWNDEFVNRLGADGDVCHNPIAAWGVV